jgi:dihydrofolate reductase
MISAIVAVDKNWGIGYNNQLLEHIPEDLKNFKLITQNNVVIMGRKTWDSLPIKPLPNRTNIVITSQKQGNIDGVKYMSLEDAKRYAVVYRPSNVYIIGGASIYKEFLPLCKTVYLTKIDKEYENVDTYFPNLDEMDEWSAAACSSVRTYNDLNYQFWRYERF